MISDDTLNIFRDTEIMIPLRNVYSAQTDSGFKNAVVYGVLMSWDSGSIHIGDGSDINTVISRRDVVTIFTKDSSFFAGTSDSFTVPEGEEYQ